MDKVKIGFLATLSGPQGQLGSTKFVAATFIDIAVRSVGAIVAQERRATLETATPDLVRIATVFAQADRINVLVA